MRGDVAEALNLRVLRRQVRDRVSNEIGEFERSLHPGGREVANRHGDLVCARLRLEHGDHRRRQFNPMHANAPPAER